MRITLLTVLLLFLAVCSAYAGQAFECDILQYKLDRLYFPFGTESNIYEYAPFTVYFENDSIFSGIMEFSSTGVSYGSPTDGYFDTIDITSLRAQISPAEIDSVSKIVIGSSNIDITDINCSFFDDSAFVFQQYDSQMKMILDFEEGLIDGYISYSMPGSLVIPGNTVSSPAPYFAVLLPNLSHEVNYHGLLCASLYYRFDSSRPYTHFSGSHILTQDCFYTRENECRRIYEYNPADGRKLLESMRQHPKRVTISTSDDALDQCAQYFADILSRDKIRMDIVHDSLDVDLRLAFVDYDTQRPEVAFNHIIELLASDTLSGDIINKSLNLAAVYLQSALGADHPKKTLHYFDKTERVLKEDLGVFPMFRPQISFVSNRGLKGYYFDDNGNLDLTNLVKLVLPKPIEDKPE